MIRLSVVSIVFTMLFSTAKATDLSAGELYYDYEYSQGPFHHILVTLKLIRQCNSNDPFPNSVVLSIFEKSTNARVGDITMLINNVVNIDSTSSNPCISHLDSLCYKVAYYTAPVSLAFSNDAYILACKVNYRQNGISNLLPGYNSIAATYTAEFPGQNETPVFTGSDMVIVCANKTFSYSAAAFDQRDVLRYSFCTAFSGNNTSNNKPTPPPPFPQVPYNNPNFSGISPLGSAVQINPVTGLISGIAPAAGLYLVTICVEETRNNLPNSFVSIHRKELLIRVTDCIVGTASLLPYGDTLICTSDNLLLHASGTGSFSWTPLVNIINANTATPTVFPTSTTTYFVHHDDGTCVTKDSVIVNVVDHVTLQTMSDTTICTADTIQLRAQSDGLHYAWSPAGQLIDPTVQDPFAVTNTSTNYKVTATIGGCTALDSILVTTVSLPLVDAGADTTICYKNAAWLHGTTDGNSWQWSPSGLVNDPGLLNATTYPPNTTDYILTVFDTRGCPKPSRDTVKVTVRPKMNIAVSSDSIVVVGQPLQLMASGGDAYLWSPGNNLSATNISNPIAVFNDPSTGMMYKVIVRNSSGCSDSAYVSIKVFKTLPVVFVPSAFTPNNDGRNDRLRPIAVGMKKIEYFNVYNRWGQLIYTTKGSDHGWDGRINGLLQPTGSFVWAVKAVDYNGKAYFDKGVFLLIR